MDRGGIKMSKALELLKEIKSYNNKPLRIMPSDKKFNEAIAELEALQQVKSCESCKHWKVRNKLVRSNECFKLSGSIMTPRDFYCSEFEAKEQ